MKSTRCQNRRSRAFISPQNHHLAIIHRQKNNCGSFKIWVGVCDSSVEPKAKENALIRWACAPGRWSTNHRPNCRHRISPIPCGFSSSPTCPWSQRQSYLPGVPSRNHVHIYPCNRPADYRPDCRHRWSPMTQIQPHLTAVPEAVLPAWGPGRNHAYL